MEDFDKTNSSQDSDLFSKAVKAGKRTYFFDVKTTRENDYYLTITESKRKVDKDGKFSYEKHKIFLYKEDFEKFEEGLLDAIDYIKEHLAEEITPRNEQDYGTYSDVKFEDLE